MTHPRIVLISLGNPAPYLNTLHSAGHHALTALRPLLGPSQPAFTSERHASKSVLASIGPQYALLQSPSLMNISGRWVSRAYRDLNSRYTPDSGSRAPTDVASPPPSSPSPPSSPPPPPLSLLLIHDDLEEDLGVVKLRKWTSSHRGHNGVKSVNASLRPADFPGARWARVSVGIGRPAAREKAHVSDYVLREMTPFQKSTLREKAGERVLRCLREWEDGLGRVGMP
ncbi:peptidyl-tRNA hydrolase [Sodiomyces alkalinus F11]|uniref:peptidyl-tRNA hydrolase n=1 Tax=Sodiomyces alkalinus (strain CBS 110278 / VKM F-3762 / F11) TaxID=1314773 RepID=A0A3N2QAB9_SODAK|nr:peptidyl-tRNA hydrolase [Sodiomyces alkalinus F11]ROT43676.1 peptidyl-tRNA hydrolase [Sodiomyces alkalinus F11]